MKINIIRNEEEGKFLISLFEVTGKGQEFGHSFVLDVEDFKTLGEKINAELEDFQKSNPQD